MFKFATFAAFKSNTVIALTALWIRTPACIMDEKNVAQVLLGNQLRVSCECSLSRMTVNVYIYSIYTRGTQSRLGVASAEPHYIVSMGPLSHNPRQVSRYASQDMKPSLTNKTRPQQNPFIELLYHVGLGSYPLATLCLCTCLYSHSSRQLFVSCYKTLILMTYDRYLKPMI